MNDQTSNRTLEWLALNYPSLEICHVETASDVYQVISAIEGTYNNKPFRLGYTMVADKYWYTHRLSLNIKIGEEHIEKYFESDGNGQWRDQNGALPGFDGCLDVDITFTPLTNTLPIRRLQLGIGDNREIKVLYADVAECEFRVSRQRYTRVSERLYKFENVPNDFEAVIEVDEEGFVLDYPGLFRRNNE